MSTSQSPRSAECQALVDAHAALNRNDIAGFIQDFDPEIERIEPPGFPTAGIYQGIQAVRAHVEQGRGTWAEGTCQPLKFCVAGDRIVVIIQVHVRLKNAANWIDAQIADVFTFHNGKVIQFCSFSNIQDGLEFADVDAPEVGVNH